MSYLCLLSFFYFLVFIHFSFFLPPIRAQVNNTFQTSLEVGVRVEAYPIGGTSRVINAAYFTYVALDKNGGKILVPEVIPVDEGDHRRFHEVSTPFLFVSVC